MSFGGKGRRFVYSHSSNLTDEQKAALRRLFRLGVITFVGVVLSWAALCVYMLLAERPNIRAVVVAMALTIIARALFLQWSGARASRITGRVSVSGTSIIFAMIVLWSVAFVAIAWYATA